MNDSVRAAIEAADGGVDVTIHLHRIVEPMDGAPFVTWAVLPEVKAGGQDLIEDPNALGGVQVPVRRYGPRHPADAFLAMAVLIAPVLKDLLTEEVREPPSQEPGRWGA
jgi:hypothetical protein